MTLAELNKKYGITTKDEDEEKSETFSPKPSFDEWNKGKMETLSLKTWGDSAKALVNVMESDVARDGKVSEVSAAKMSKLLETAEKFRGKYKSNSDTISHINYIENLLGYSFAANSVRSFETKMGKGETLSEDELAEYTKATQNYITSGGKLFTENNGYDQAAINWWQRWHPKVAAGTARVGDHYDFTNQLKSLEHYQTKLANHEYMTQDEVDEYSRLTQELIKSGNNLYKEDFGFDSGAVQKWREDSILLGNSSRSALDFYSQFDSEEEYTEWKDFYDRFGHYATAEDFEEYAAKGAAIENPTYDDAQHNLVIGPWKWGAEPVGNIVTFSRDNVDDITTDMSGDEKFHVVGNYLYTYMSDDEVGIYNYLLAKEGNEKAKEFLDYIEPLLKDRFESGVLERTYALAEEHPFWASVLSVGTSVGSGFEYIADVIDYSGDKIAGRDAKLDTNLGALQTNAIRGTVAEKVDWEIKNWDAFDFLYGTTMSAADSLVASAMFGNAGGVALGLSAAAQGTNDALNRGMSDGQAFWSGFFSGVFEGLFETISIGKFNKLKNVSPKSIKSVCKNIGKSMLVNASDETLTEIANIAYDTMVNGEFANYTWDELKNGAWKNAMYQVVEAGASGALMGIGMGGIGNSIGYSKTKSKYRNAGKSIMGADGGVAALKTLAMDVAGATDGKTAKNLTKMADDATSYVHKGKGVVGKMKARAANRANALNVGRLASEVSTANKIANTEVNKADIVKSLTRNEFSTEKANAIADALLTAYNGQELSGKQERLLRSVENNKDVQDVVDRIINNDMSTMGQRHENVRNFQVGVKAANDLGISVDEYMELADIIKKAGKMMTSMPASDGQVTGKLTGKKSLQVDEEAVAADGQAEIGGNKVVLNGLRENADGSVVVATADDQTAYPGDVKYPSSGHALVYQNYANIEAVTDNPVLANMAVDTRSMLARAYNPATGVAAEDYFFGSNLSYQYGFEGIPMNDKTVSENPILSSITGDQRDLAYDLGRKAGRQAADTQDAGIHKAYEKAVEKLGGKGAAAAIAKKNPGKVVLRDGIVEDTMKEKQKAAYKLAKTVSKATGVTINIYMGMREHGKYNPATGEIWLNINSNISGSSMMAFTLAHELVHMAKQWKPADFKTFADYLFEQYGKKGVSVDALIREQMTKAKENGYTLNEHEAYEEVIADACQRMLLDSDALQKMAAYKEKNPGNWQKIVNKIREFITSIRNLFKGAEPDSMEAERYKSLDEDAKQYLEKLFVDMVMGAGEHMSTIRNAFGKGTVVEVNADGEFTLAKGNVDGATKFLYNDATWENGGRDTLKAALEAEGFSNEDIKAALTIMDGKHEMVKELAKEFPEQDRINKATITTDLKDGHSVLSALVSNGDYPVNIDLLMVCKKRKAYQRVINRLCETGLIQQATVDALAIAEINKILGKYGFKTACLGCFVESRRLRIQEWAETIVKEWNGEVKKRNPNAKAFGFGKGEATLTEDEVMQLVGELEGHAKNDQGNLNLGQGSAVKRMGVLLDKVPSLAKTLTVEDLITPDGLTALRQYDSNLFSMVKSRYGSNSPKFVQEFNPYNHELAKYGKVPKEYKSLREYLYAIGGARMQSFSDFIVENWFDYCQIVADLAARKLPMHTYTKEISLAKLFGLTGIKINMSLIPDIDRSMGRDFAGLTRNEKGELELIWADKDRFKKTGGKSYMQSINFADAIALQNDPRYSGNVGTIAVGVSKNHILMMLDDARIRMIIPYHSSGMNPIFADLMGTSYYTDYTNVQNTRVKQLYNSKGQKVSMKLDKTQTGKLTAGFQFNEVLQELGDARAAADAYKAWCADASKHTITIKGETYTAELTPKFDEFAKHDNYYKLLEDFNTYDCISEEAAPQGDVQQTYPDNFDEILKAELTAQESHRQKQEKNQAFDKAMGEIESFLSTHTKADTVFYAEQHGVKLSEKDKKLNAADKAKIAGLRKGMKMSMPKAKAPTFYSHMARVVDGLKQEKLGAASIVSTLRNKGVKVEEIKWSGIEAWLEGKKSVTKAELQTFIAGSMLQIEEEVLDNKDRPYTEDQQKRLDEYEAKRTEVADRLAAEWKKITGKALSIRNGETDLESAVVNAIIDENQNQKNAAFEGRLLEKLRKDLSRVIMDNDYFGFDSLDDAMRSIHRHRRDFTKHIDASTNDKVIIVKYCNALNAYNELPNKISDADTDRLRAIAREAGKWNRKIMEVKKEHNEYEAKYMTNWKEYSLDGGKNYREMLFRIPGSTYSNVAMYAHWKERMGVLAHARVQDMDAPNGKMLFIEEIQSDWHNEGHKSGYRKEGEKTDFMLRRESEKAYKEFYTAVEKMLEDNANWEDDNAVYYAHPVVVAEMFEGNESHFDQYGFTEEQRETIRSMVAEEAARQEALKTAPKHDTAPDAPFKDNYHEYVLKRLLREAAENGYDSIGWTPAATQMDRWNPDRKTNAQMGITDAKNPDAVAFEEAYRNLYDRRAKKFLENLGDKWGATVGKTTLDNGTEVWSMDVTDSMKDSVLYEGQPKYSMPKVSNEGYNTTHLAWAIESDIINENDQARFWEAIAEIRKLNYNSFARTKNGGFIIETKDKMMFTDGDFKAPTLSKVICFTFDGGKDVDETRRMIRDEAERTGRTDESVSFAEELYGSWFIAEYNARDYQAYAWKNGRGEGAYRSGTSAESEGRGVRYGGENEVREGRGLKNKSPNSRGMSPRQLLADAFDDLVQNPKERELMAEYRKNIANVEDVQERLRKLRGRISELTKENGDKAKIAEMNKTAKGLAELIDKYDRKLLDLEASKPLKDVLARAKSAAYQEARERSEKSLKEYRQQVSERFDRGIENRRKTEMRKKIRKTIRDLDKILNRGDKKRNVKEGMKDFVAEALASSEVLFTDNYTNDDIVRNGFGVELSEAETKYLEEVRKYMDELASLPAGSYEAMQARMEAEEQLKSKIAYRMSKLKDAFFRERQRLNKTEVAEILGKLADAYAKLESSEYAYVNGAYQDNVHQYLKWLQDEVGGAKVKDMTLSQLESLHKAYTMVLTTVQMANKLFTSDIKMSKEEAANRVMMEVYEAGGEHGLWTKGQLSRNQYSWNNTKPIYAAERTGSKTFVQLVNGLFKGQYNWAVDMAEAKDFRLQVAKKYGFKNWDMEKTYKFTSSSGIEFELNLNQIMALYAYAKREQAHDHLLKGGFVFGKNTEVVVTKNGIKRTYLNKSAKAHNISDEIMGEIVSNLTDEQKGFVDEMQDYLSTTMGNKGNEVSMRLYGVKLFMEKFYFPLRSAGQFKEKAKEAELKQQQGQISIVNSGFTHSTTPKASNPVVLDGFTDVWASHVNEMSLYHSMVLPMEDFRRVYNYASPNMEGQESASVNSFIENAYGDAATGYFDQLYKELNGGAIVDPRENGLKKAIGKFKKGAVILSNSVWVQQFSAIGRATAEIDLKYFVGAKVDKQKHAILWDEVKKYAPVAIIKEMGGFDTHTGLSAKDYLLAEEYGKGERTKAFLTDKQYRSEVTGYLPQKADELTWCAIWEAVKRETQANNPKMDVKSEEFLKKAGERFSEVIEKTQVYDSVLARSANMRSKNALMQIITAFMAEPTTTINMIENALRKGNKKFIARTFGAVAASIIINNALASIIYAMRDDDEDETFLEKYTQAFTSGMLDDINPATYYPILKDIWSLFQGYDIERSDMAIYSDVVDALKRTVVTLAKYDSEMDEDETAEYYSQLGSALMSLPDAGAAWFGVPLKNVRRDLYSYYNTYKTVTGDQENTWSSFVDAVKGSAKDSAPIVGWLPGDSKTDKIYDAIIDGDTVYLERLKGGYKDTNAYNNAVKKALLENDPRIKEAAEAHVNGDPSERVRIAKLVVADGFPQDAVVMAINSQINDLTPDDGNTGTKKEKGYYTTSDFAREIANGDWDAAETARNDVIATAQKNGKSEEEAEESFASSAKSEIRDLFVAGKMSESNAAKALKTYCPAKDGPLDDNDIYWIIREWEYEMENGSTDDYGKYNDFHGAVETGRDLVAVISEYTSHGVKKETLASEITSHFKPLYREMSSSKRATFKKYLLNAYVQLGYDRSKKSKDIDKWLED